MQHSLRQDIAAMVLGRRIWEEELRNPQERRGYAVGDYLCLQEWDNGEYTGKELTRKIVYIYAGDGSYGLQEGYCILGLENDGMALERNKA